MGHVKSGNIHPQLRQSGNLVMLTGFGSYGTNDFCSSHKSKNPPLFGGYESLAKQLSTRSKFGQQA
jgi:hypothetical protein